MRISHEELSMYTKFDKSLIKSLQNINKNKPIVKQIEASYNKIFTDIAKNLLYNTSINLKKSQKDKLRRKKKQIEKIITSKNKKTHINQVGGFLLPFILPLINQVV